MMTTSSFSSSTAHDLSILVSNNHSSPTSISSSRSTRCLQKQSEKKSFTVALDSNIQNGHIHNSLTNDDHDEEKFEGRVVLNNGVLYIFQTSTSSVVDGVCQIESFIDNQEDSIVILNSNSSSSCCDDDDTDDSSPCNLDLTSLGRDTHTVVHVRRQNEHTDPTATLKRIEGVENVADTKQTLTSSSSNTVVHVFLIQSCSEEREHVNNYNDQHRHSAALPVVIEELSSPPVGFLLICLTCRLTFHSHHSLLQHCVTTHSQFENVSKTYSTDSLISKRLSVIIGVDNTSKPDLKLFTLQARLESECDVDLIKSEQQEDLDDNQIRSPVDVSHLVSTVYQTPNTSGDIAASPSSQQSSPSRPSNSLSPSENQDSCLIRSPTKFFKVQPPEVSPSKSPYSTSASNANMLQGTTIGACPDHVNGRPTGVECTKCDVMLNQSRVSNQGWNLTRNSCKTLKCPKCNWHYKYQETLEIHMKEKHPESETTCMFCATNQQHPRLARGETYTCGYKPYRCEVCNYSTTTKGNLSIHMQSDKHLNNMQEIQNGGGQSDNGPPSNEQSHQLTPPSPQQSKSPVCDNTTTANGTATITDTMETKSQQTTPGKLTSTTTPNFRCELCNYETNVARNLRIHMTSEKHTQNVALSQLGGANVNLGQPLPPNIPHLSSNLLPSSDNQSLNAATLFQLQQNLAALISRSSSSPVAAPNTAPEKVLQVSGGPFSPNSHDMKQNLMSQILLNSKLNGLNTSSQQVFSPSIPVFTTPSSSNDAIKTKENIVIPPVDEDFDNTTNCRGLFTCNVCNNFDCDSLDSITRHLNLDRSKVRENEVYVVIGNSSHCQLCNYKTNLKANFQLHCKTDKHLQRLSHINHIKEGGQRNEWKLNNLSNTNPIELRCNACNFVSNSPHKLYVHSTGQSHQMFALIFAHFKQKEMRLLDCVGSESNKKITIDFNCLLCNFSTINKSNMMNHVRNYSHLQMEQIYQLKKNAEGFDVNDDPFQMFTITSSSSSLPSNNAQSDMVSDENVCPLCQTTFGNFESLESHALDVHSINSECLLKLQSLISKLKESSQSKDDCEVGFRQVSNEKPHTSPPQQQQTTANTYIDKYLDPNRPFKCHTCKESFTQKNILLVHFNSVSHLNRVKKLEGVKSSSDTNDFATLDDVLKKGIISEECAYKCNICRVQYSKLSQLEEHVRSLLHQSKAVRLNELILSGQIDLSKPLIEQPVTPEESKRGEERSSVEDMLSPKSLNSTGSTNSHSSPVVVSSSPTSRSSPQSSPLSISKNSMLCQRKSQEGGGHTTYPSKTEKSFSLMETTNNNSESSSQPSSSHVSDVLQSLLQNYSNELMKHTANNTPVEEARLNSAMEEDHNNSVEEQHQANNLLQDVFQKILLQAQLQQQLNPLLMHMNNLQQQQQQQNNNNFVNPFLAMNLQPPLISPQQQQQSPKQPNSFANDSSMSIIGRFSKNNNDNGGSNIVLPDNALYQQHTSLVAPPPLDNAMLMQLLASQQKQRNDESQALSTTATSKSSKCQESGGRKSSSQSNTKNSNTTTSMLSNKQIPIPIDPSTLLLQQQPVQVVDPNKRARTRITDEQLKILRSHFDINNSPAEEQLNMMAQQTGLPLKVIKHWFRNTLFKERQKNKDSPYNFNNPPSTKLNLDEFEGSVSASADKVENIVVHNQIIEDVSIQPDDNVNDIKDGIIKKEVTPVEEDLSMLTPNVEVKVECEDSNSSRQMKSMQDILQSVCPSNATTVSSHQEVLTSSLPSQLSTSSTLSNMTQIISENSNGMKLSEYFTSLSSLMPVTQSEPLDVIGMDQLNRSHSPNSNSGKRANRTRFTDYQIRVLQEFFDKNAYPKDDDLEYLSKLLGLSPRVIVVWFQNARQKARKVYENQPSAASDQEISEEEESGRFTRTSGCNYQCKKCLLIFQRYYELIRHQKQHCYKEEDARRSAQAQKAAANAAAQFCASGANINGGSIDHSEHGSDSSFDGNAIHPLSPPTYLSADNQMSNSLSVVRNNESEIQKLLLAKMNEVMSPVESTKRKLSDSDDSTEYKGSEEKKVKMAPSGEQISMLLQKFWENTEPDFDHLKVIANQVQLPVEIVDAWFNNIRMATNAQLNPMANELSSHFQSNPLTNTMVNINKAIDNNSIQSYYEDTMKRFLSDLNNSASSMNSSSANVIISTTAESENGDSGVNSSDALDLTSNPNGDDSSCVNIDCDTEMNENTVCGNQNSSFSSVNNNNNNYKRFRTQMSALQVKILRGIFEVYKNPTMPECSTLGMEIGLQKRVVQVWFQNARAKEKRARMQLENILHNNNNANNADFHITNPPSDACKICNVSYTSKFGISEHIFTTSHLDQLRIVLEQGSYEPETPGVISGANGTSINVLSVKYSGVDSEESVNAISFEDDELDTGKSPVSPSNATSSTAQAVSQAESITIDQSNRLAMQV